MIGLNRKLVTVASSYQFMGKAEDKQKRVTVGEILDIHSETKQNFKLRELSCMFVLFSANIPTQDKIIFYKPFHHVLQSPVCLLNVEYFQVT